MVKPRHILVIRLSAMGDVAMVVPVLRAAGRSYPELKFTMLTKKFFAPLFHGLDNVEVLQAEVKGEHKGLPGLKKLAGEVSSKKVDAVADLHNVLRSKILKRFFWFYGIPVKQIDKGRAKKRALTRSGKKIFEPLKSTHQRYGDVLAKLGYPIDFSKAEFRGKRKLSRTVLKLVGNKARKWIGIAPFAQHSSKIYPPDLMREVLSRLSNSQNIDVFLFGGGEGEGQLMSQWEKEFRNVKNVSGKLTFGEELDLISNLDAMISMDSGNGHLAANFGIPVITLWGLTHPHTGFVPFGQSLSNSLLPDLVKYPKIPTSIYGTKIPAGYENVMRTISPESVVEKVRNVTLISD